ncbi:MAG TPA: hypothetical protein VMT68_16945 [Caulobacteraceae bacterium]|nr:hypothetical protein [Caulobacteraceae bacterium]
MPAFAAAGASFLIAVLWFDLMFDVQARKHGLADLPPDVLASIGAYYRRVTTEAHPMGRLVALVMLATLAALAAEIAARAAPWWIAWPSLVLTLSAVGLALGRTVRNAARLGAGEGDASARSRLARRVLLDHVYCLGAMAVVAALQLLAAVR